MTELRTLFTELWIAFQGLSDPAQLLTVAIFILLIMILD